jgi:hypothetical protein
MLNKILMLVKPFMSAEVANRLHFHVPNSDTLYKHVPREILPVVSYFQFLEDF